MTKPAKLKLTIYQGATFRKRLTWRAPSKAPIDLTGEQLDAPFLSASKIEL